MPEEYSKEQLWELYEKLPEELKETIFSEKTANNIYDICIRNGIEDDRISEIARYTGRVLLGILLPEDFQEILEKKVKLKKEVAKKVSREIFRFIFYPVKASLEELYNVPITPPPAIPKVKPPTPPKDIYREPLE